MHSFPFLAAAISVLALAAQVPAPTPTEARIAWNQAHYLKTETFIPMRDGKQLFTVIFTPRDTSRTYPILLNRTPYGQNMGMPGSGYGKDKAVPFMADVREACFAEDGFIFVGQDVRGRYRSAAGDWEEIRPIHPTPRPGTTDEATDAYDTIDWLIRNVPGNNGRVGIYGQSYDGFYASAGLVRQHPALKAAILSAPVTDWWDGDDIFRNGAFRLAANFAFYAYIFSPQRGPVEVDPFKVPPTPDGYTYLLNLSPLSEAGPKAGMDPENFWNVLVRHPDRDAFAKARDVRPHLRNVTAAVLTVGGWFDHEDLFGSLNTHKALEAQNPGLQNGLVLGPWVHGAWREQGPPEPGRSADQLSSIRFGERLALDFQERVELPFLRHHLKGEGSFTPAKARVFRTGGNTWHELGAWPPGDVQRTPVYLRKGGLLAFAPQQGGGRDTFVSDPAHPVPYTQAITMDYAQAFMTEDQRFAATRPDVLVYQTGPLAEDLTLAGAVKADLWVAITGTDTDWVVKVIDVWPDDAVDPEGQPMGGYEQLVRGDILRGKFRNSLEKPEPFVPGKPTRVAFDLFDCFHTFLKGHRFMVQVQSSWFPLFDRNPQVFMANIMDAAPGTFRKSTNTVFTGAGHPSRVVLPVYSAERTAATLDGAHPQGKP